MYKNSYVMDVISINTYILKQYARKLLYNLQEVTIN